MTAQLAGPLREVEVARDHGHPSDGRPGFDILTITTKTEGARDEAVKNAQAKFWSVWICGFNTGNDDSPSAVLYKPSGLNAPWIDSPNRPHPGCCNGVEKSQKDHEAWLAGQGKWPKQTYHNWAETDQERWERESVSSDERTLRERAA